jgi:hypothetical protein
MTKDPQQASPHPRPPELPPERPDGINPSNECVPSTSFPGKLPIGPARNGQGPRRGAPRIKRETPPDPPRPTTGQKMAGSVKSCQINHEGQYMTYAYLISYIIRKHILSQTIRLSELKVKSKNNDLKLMANHSRQQ